MSSQVAVARTTLEEFDDRRVGDLSRVEMAFWLGQLSHALRVLTGDDIVIALITEDDGS